mgnify:CR=1 FL=1
MVGVLGIVTQIFVRSADVYDTQRKYVDAQYSTAAALDMMVRLFRAATTIRPDPDGVDRARVDQPVQLLADADDRSGVLQGLVHLQDAGPSRG